MLLFGAGSIGPLATSLLFPQTGAALPFYPQKLLNLSKNYCWFVWLKAKHYLCWLHRCTDECSTRQRMDHVFLIIFLQQVITFFSLTILILEKSELYTQISEKKVRIVRKKVRFVRYKLQILTFSSEFRVYISQIWL